MGKTKNLNKNERKALSIAHPNSRKAARLAKQTLREEGRKKQKVKNSIKQNLFGERLLWFQENLEDDIVCYSAQQANQLFSKYLSRFDEELEQIELKHSIGQRRNRQHASRQDAINITKENNTNEFNSGGIEMVDVMNPLQLDKLRKWDGNMGFLNQFKMRFFSRTFFQSYKPPKDREASDDKMDDSTADKPASPQ